MLVEAKEQIETDVQKEDTKEKKEETLLVREKKAARRKFLPELSSLIQGIIVPQDGVG